MTKAWREAHRKARAIRVAKARNPAIRAWCKAVKRALKG